MANHICLDPHDPYAQAEVLVIFDGEWPDIHLLSVIDKDDDEILPDLIDDQRRDLVREIAAFHAWGLETERRPGAHCHAKKASQPDR